MNRAEFIKTASAFAAASVLPIDQLYVTSDIRKFHLIGLGNAGIGVINYCIEKDNKIKYSIINTKTQEKHHPNINFFEFTRPSNAYLENKTSIKKVNTDTVITYNELPKNINTIFSDKNTHYIFCSFSGGFTGSYLSLHLSKQAYQEGLQYSTIASIPPHIMSPFQRKASLIIKDELQKIPNTFFLIVKI